MAYGSIQEPGYTERLKQAQAERAQRAEEARQHVAALLRGVQAQENANPLLARLVLALERIAAAQERVHPPPPPPAPAV